MRRRILEISGYYQWWNGTAQGDAAQSLYMEQLDTTELLYEEAESFSRTYDAMKLSWSLWTLCQAHPQTQRHVYQMHEIDPFNQK